LTWALLCTCAVASAYGEVIDRIAVTLDRQVITESDLILDLRVDAFIDRKPVDLSVAARRQAAERLVDQILMFREAADSHLDLSMPEDGPMLIAQEKSQFPSDDEYRNTLAEYRIRESELQEHLLNGLRALRFANLRFSPEVQISEGDLREYYDKLAASWRTAGRSPIPSFADSRDQVEKLLTQERTMESLDAWLSTQRQSKQIQYREAAFK